MGGGFSSKKASGGAAPPVVSYKVIVTTGDQKGASSNAPAYVRLEGADGTSSPDANIDNWLKDDFKSGATDEFRVESPALGDVAKVFLWRTGTDGDADWFVDEVVVEAPDGKQTPFPCFRWITDQPTELLRYDAVLPQHDEARRGQRQRELDAARVQYQYNIVDNGLPRRILEMPACESFSNEALWDIISLKAKMLANKGLARLLSVFDSWDSLDDFGDLYVWPGLSRPAVAASWRDDATWGRQRLAGCNPVVIARCDALPDKFPVTDELLGDLLGGSTIAEEMAARRLFLLDYHMLDDAEAAFADVTDDPERKARSAFLCAPLVLMWRSPAAAAGDVVLPVAVQLRQRPGADNPIFTPRDPPNLWTLAKIFVSNADVHHHQCFSHLCRTHLVMECIAVSTNRQLSISHPVHRLLKPHLVYLLAINTRGFEKLVNPGGWIDNTMTMGVTGSMFLMSRAYQTFRFRPMPEEFAERGVDSPDVLPYYPYRDDAMLYWEAIHRFVTRFVEAVYAAGDADVAGDDELQAWAQELGTDGGVHGLPEGHAFATRAQLADFLSALILCATQAHGSVNMAQYDHYGWVPNMPAITRRGPPTTKDEVSEADILATLPDKATSLDQIAVTKLLSATGDISIGEYQKSYFVTDELRAAVDAFQAEIRDIGSTITARNEAREHPYPYLHPDMVPNSIAI